MGILKSAADLVYTIRFLKLLVTPFNKMDAFKAGIINDKGEKNKDFNTDKLDDRRAYENHYTAFHRLVFNIKKLMAKVPGGGSRLASYAAALYLIKEHGELSQENVDKIHDETGIDLLDLLEEDHKWYMVEGNQLSPGLYKMRNPSMTCQSYLNIVEQGDKIRIEESKMEPIGQVLGINIYEAVHLKSNQRIYISTGEITR